MTFNNSLQPRPPKGINNHIIIRIYILVLFCFSCVPSGNYIVKKRSEIAQEGPFIRVLLKKTRGRILITSNSNLRITEIKSRKIKYEGSGKKFFFYPEKVKQPVLVEAPGSILSVDNISYRGMIELHNSLGNLAIINIVKMNEYLYGVVPAEIPSSWNLEAIKAQAVAARTYTYFHLMKQGKTLYDLDATTSFQVYRGLSIETPQSRLAVDETTGDIAVFDSRPILAFFHSTCGGRTTDDKNVWSGDDQSYLASVRCKYCRESPYFKWEEKLGLYEIRHTLGRRYRGIGPITGISLKRQETRVDMVIIRHKNGILTLTGNDFRLLFPENRIKSMYFQSRQTADGIVLYGNGWGHGVGMCQWGAKGMADSGAGYREILMYYYKGISIVNSGKMHYAAR